MKISGVYKITNIVTGDFYIGSSKDVNKRWACHKCPSIWQRYPNNPMYLDMKKYGTDKFELQILAEVEIASLKEAEQQLIEKLKPVYNDRNANGWDVERQKEHKKEYQKKSEKYKEYKKSDEYKKSHRITNNKYQNQPCFYKGEILALHTLSERFRRAGVEYYTIEAKKYLIK